MSVRFQTMLDSCVEVAFLYGNCDRFCFALRPQESRVAIHSERAVVETGNIGSDNFVVAAGQRAMAKIYVLSKIGSQTKTPHDGRIASLLVEGSGLTACLVRLYPF
jgi:hypothetical protein